MFNVKASFPNYHFSFVLFFCLLGWNTSWTCFQSFSQKTNDDCHDWGILMRRNNGAYELWLAEHWQGFEFIHNTDHSQTHCCFTAFTVLKRRRRAAKDCERALRLICFQSVHEQNWTKPRYNVALTVQRSQYSLCIWTFDRKQCCSVQILSVL